MSETANALSSRINERLEALGTRRIYPEGETIIQDNSVIRSIPIVKSGAIRVMRVDEEGKELFLYYVKPGESCIMSFLGGMHRERSKIKAVAEEESEILYVPVENLPVLLKEYPEWLDYIFRLYHKRFEELLQVVNEVAFKKMDERILSILKEKKDLTGHAEIHITHQLLAEELGTSRVVVSRLLKQLESEGTVSLGRNKITLL
jgi:CRP/FNR family transcriptional regulator